MMSVDNGAEVRIILAQVAESAARRIFPLETGQLFKPPPLVCNIIGAALNDLKNKVRRRCGHPSSCKSHSIQ